MQKKIVSVRTAILYLVGVAQVLLAPSSNSLIVVCLIPLALVLLQRKVTRRFLNAYTYISAYAVAYVSIVVLRLQGFFDFLIEGLLGKSLSFTGRTEIWDAAISNVVETNLLIGCGKDWFAYGGEVVSSAHNMILETFVQGGLLDVLSLVTALMIAALSLYRSRLSRSSAYLAMGLGCFLLIGLMEQMRWAAFFFFLVLSCSWVAKDASTIEPTLEGDAVLRND